MPELRNVHGQVSRRLSQLLLHCRERVPFYRERLEGLEVENDPLGALRALPISSKKEIRSAGRACVTEELQQTVQDRAALERVLAGETKWPNDTLIELPSRVPVYFEHTSGSTGVPLCMIKSTADRMRCSAALWQARRHVEPALRTAELFAFDHGPPDREFPFDKRDRSPTNVLAMLAEIRQRGHTWLHSHPQLLSWWADVLRDSGQRVTGFRFLETLGAKVYPHQRRHLEEHFGCPIVDSYGCRELWSIGYECRHGRLHQNEASTVLEVVDAHGREITDHGRVGRLVVSSLCCTTMPFLRYELGDDVAYVPGPCPCGSSAPAIEVLAGSKYVQSGEHDVALREVFSSITRYLYADFEFRFSEVKVVQARDGTFDIYTGAFRGDRAAFESWFHRIASAMLTASDTSFRMHFVDFDHAVFARHPRQLFVSE